VDASDGFVIYCCIAHPSHRQPIFYVVAVASRGSERVIIGFLGLAFAAFFLFSWP
jgi:hypothetical protein